MTLFFYARHIGTNCVLCEASKLYKWYSSFNHWTRSYSRSICVVVHTPIWQSNVLANQRLGNLKQRFPTCNTATANESLIHLGTVPSLCCESLRRTSVEHDTAYETKVAKMSCSHPGSGTFFTGRLH